MKRKTIYVLIAAVSIVIASVVYLPKHAWRAISWDGYGDATKRMGARLVSWKLINDGAIVDEAVHTYASSEDARKAFREELEGKGAIIESKGTAEDTAEDNARVVKVYGNPETKEGAAQIIRLQGKEIRYIDAGSLKYALAFEKDWLKVDF